MSAALHLKPWTDQRLTLAAESTGKKSGTTAGSYIADLVSLKKAILLCPACLPKFGAAQNGYVTQSRMPMCGGRCDGCKDNGMDRRLFLHHSQLPR